MTHIRRVADLDELGTHAAAAALEILHERQEAGEIPTVVLTGGRAGARFLRALGEHRNRDRVNWQRVRLLWGDERWVPAGDAERNDRQLDETLAQAVELDPALVYRMPHADSGLDLDAAAEAYAAVVGAVDRIDLAVNGVGEDGHVASLFPGRDDLLGVGPTVPAAIAVRESPKPPAERISLSVATLRRADQLWLFASGTGKSAAVRELLQPDASAAPLPAALVSSGISATLWADDAALSLTDAASG